MSLAPKFTDDIVLGRLSSSTAVQDGQCSLVCDERNEVERGQALEEGAVEAPQGPGRTQLETMKHFEYHPEIHEKSPKPLFRNTPLFRPVRMGFRQWINSVSDSIEFEIGKRFDDRSRALRKRAVAIRHCITKAKGNICDCGEPQEKSGRLDGNGNPCQSRSCPRCGRRRAATQAEWAAKVVEHVEQNHSVDGHGWKHIVLTCQYDPSDGEDVAVDALRERANGLRRSWAKCWKEFRDSRVFQVNKVRYRTPENAGAWCSLEISGNGHVHLHVLYYGRYIKEKEEQELTNTARKGWSGIGFVYIGKVKDADGAREVLKYSVKSPGAHNEDWLANRASWREDKDFKVIHPRLAARWEIAMYGVRLGDRYGVFRAVVRPEDETVEEMKNRDRLQECCKACGQVGAWNEVEMSVPKWVQMCRERGLKAFGQPVLSDRERAKVLGAEQYERERKWRMDPNRKTAKPPPPLKLKGLPTRGEVPGRPGQVCQTLLPKV